MGLMIFILLVLLGAIGFYFYTMYWQVRDKYRLISARGAKKLAIERERDSDDFHFNYELKRVSEKIKSAARSGKHETNYHVSLFGIPSTRADLVEQELNRRGFTVVSEDTETPGTRMPERLLKISW